MAMIGLPALSAGVVTLKAWLTDLLPDVANCSKGKDSASIYDRCKARFEATIPRHRLLSLRQTNDYVAVALAAGRGAPDP